MNTKRCCSCNTKWECTGKCDAYIRYSNINLCYCFDCLIKNSSTLKQLLSFRGDTFGRIITVKELQDTCYPTVRDFSKIVVLEI